ncbi:MAG: hypothetical protein CEE38_08440 [Planctomycetes bacterium B3_Pla]|nr:MAG: hypothetical protein CEE38_08440 [Planctomycetes bacterium B3_Pla]
MIMANFITRHRILSDEFNLPQDVSTWLIWQSGITELYDLEEILARLDQSRTRCDMAMAKRIRLFMESPQVLEFYDTEGRICQSVQSPT